MQKNRQEGNEVNPEVLSSELHLCFQCKLVFKQWLCLTAGSQRFLNRDNWQLGGFAERRMWSDLVRVRVEKERGRHGTCRD